MAIFGAETYVIKPERLSEFPALAMKYETFMKEHPDLFKEVVSHKIYSQMLGGKWGGYVELSEFKSMADVEKVFTKLMQNQEFLTKIYQSLMALIVPGSYSVEIWNSFP